MTTTLIEAVIDETLFSLGEICERCDIHAELVIEMVEHGIVAPSAADSAQNRWRFSVAALQRLQRARRLQSDLHINLPGVALSLELLDRIDALEQQVTSLQQQLQRHRND